MRIATIAALCAALAGCGGVPIAQVPKEVQVAVLAPCVAPGKRPARPPFRTDAELELLDDYRYTLAMASERDKAHIYIRELEAVVEGCSRIPALPTPPSTKK